MTRHVRLAAILFPLAFSLSQCKKFSNSFNPEQHACGISDWGPYVGRGLFRLLSPDGAPVDPQSVGHVTFRREGNLESHAVLLSPAGCFALEKSARGVLEATVPTQGWGVAAALTGTEPSNRVVEVRLTEIRPVPVKLPCPRKNVVASPEELLLPFAAFEEARSPGTRFFLELANQGEGQQLHLHAEKSAEGNLLEVGDDRRVVANLSDGKYAVTARSVDLLERSSSSLPCALELNSRTPEVPRPLGPATVEASQPFEVSEIADARNFICFESEGRERGGCLREENFREFRRYAKLPGPGKWKAFVFSEGPSGKRSPISSWSIVGDGAGPSLRVRWLNPELAATPSLVQSYGTEFAVKVEANDDTASELQMLTRLQCRVEISDLLGQNVKKGHARCASPSCRGKPLDAWTPCESPFRFTLTKERELWDTTIKVLVKTTDETGHGAEAEVSTWNMHGAVEPWNLHEGDAALEKIGTVTQFIRGAGSSWSMFLLGDALFGFNFKKRSISDLGPLMSPYSQLHLDKNKRLWWTGMFSDLNYFHVGDLIGAQTPEVTTVPISGEREMRFQAWFWEQGENSLKVLLPDGKQHRFDETTQRWVATSPPLSNQEIVRAVYGAKGNVWALSEQGKLLLLSSGVWNPPQGESPLLDAHFLAHEENPQTGDEELWYVTAAGNLVHSRFSEGRLLPLHTIPFPPKASVLSVVSSQILVGLQDGGLLHWSQGRWNPVALPAVSTFDGSNPVSDAMVGITQIEKWPDSNLWVGGTKGAAHYDTCHWLPLPLESGDTDSERAVRFATPGAPYDAVFMLGKTRAVVVEKDSLRVKAISKETRDLPTRLDSLFVDSKGNLCESWHSVREFRWANLRDETLEWKTCGPATVGGAGEASEPCKWICEGGDSSPGSPPNGAEGNARENAPALPGQGSFSLSSVSERTRVLGAGGSGYWELETETKLLFHPSGRAASQVVALPKQAGASSLPIRALKIGNSRRGQLSLLADDGAVFESALSGEWKLVAPPMPQNPSLGQDGGFEVWAGDGEAWVFARELFHWDENGWRSFRPEQSGLISFQELFLESGGRVWLAGGGRVALFNPHCQPLVP